MYFRYKIRNINLNIENHFCTVFDRSNFGGFEPLFTSFVFLVDALFCVFDEGSIDGTL
jgi:hypothetical protein